MKRRNFIKYSSIVVGTPSVLSGCQNPARKNLQKSLKSFIVSDAHIGWRGKDQPTIDKQAQAVQNIINRFKDLDLTFDTGDVHHGYLKEKQRIKARTQWINHIANPFSKTLFHYVPGNHELGKGYMDPELIACSFGSIPHRPYYSFDSMGIHFISLPQLQSTILISKETINWLKLNLQLNKDKTTIIMSHNSLKGTTFDNGETGYRCLTNSQELALIISQNPQIKAWFHGHNHHYEVNKINEVLYVSNGRIGGFNPPSNWGSFGQGHLGGIYFEVDTQGISVKAYSADENKFFDQLGFPNLTVHLKTRTSFDPNQPFNYYCGNGNALDGVSESISQNYVSKRNSQLIYADTDSVINDNENLNYETKYSFSNKPVEKIIGYKISSNKVKFENANNGLAISNPKSIKTYHITFPTQKNKKNGNYKRGSYFRTKWEQAYQLYLEIVTTQSQIADISLEIILYNEHYKEVAAPSNVIKSIQGNQLYFNFNTGVKSMEVQNLYLYFKLKFKNCIENIQINKIQLVPEASTHSKSNSGLVNFNGFNHSLNNLHAPQLIELKRTFNNLNTLTFKNKKNPSTCFVLKQPAVEWQIRNGSGYFTPSGTLRITPPRHSFTNHVETIITPTFHKNLYINSCQIKNPVDIQYITDEHIKITTKNTADLSNFSVVSTLPPKQIKGAKVVKQISDTYFCQPTAREIELVV